MSTSVSPTCQHAELLVEAVDVALIELVLEPDDQIVADVSRGVVVAIKLDDVLCGFLGVGGDEVQPEVFLVDHAECEKLFLDERVEAIPV